MQIHAELSYYCLHFAGKKSDGETHPSEFSNINGRDLTHDTCILPHLRLRLISLCDSVSSPNTGMLEFIWWHYLTDRFINVSRNLDTMGAIICQHREN